MTLAACVVLLHGLARTSGSMDKLEDALHSEGYQVANVDYPSRKKPIEALAPLAMERGLEECRKSHPEKIHFVTHSLGGILVRYYLSKHSIPELGRVVMLGPPNQGSEVVDKFSGIPGYRILNGPAGYELGTDPGSIPNKLGPVTYPVGVIAGTKSINLILSLSFDEPNDGKVSLTRARVAGMTDFITVPASHPFLMRDSEAIRQTLEFLRNGHFIHEKDVQ
jgi:hypothetical protein